MGYRLVYCSEQIMAPIINGEAGYTVELSAISEGVLGFADSTLLISQFMLRLVLCQNGHCLSFYQQRCELHMRKQK